MFRLNKLLAASGVLSLSLLTLAGLNMTAQAADAPQDQLCGVTFSGGGYTYPDTVRFTDDEYVEGQLAGQFYNWGSDFKWAPVTDAGVYVISNISLSIPDSCSVGNKAYIDMPLGFHGRMGVPEPLKDAEGNTIARVSTTQAEGSSRKATRLVFTFTDYVDKNVGVTGQYSWQMQEGYDKGGAYPTVNTKVNVALTGSDGSEINPIKWFFRGGRYYLPRSVGGWAGTMTDAKGSSLVGSYISWTGTEDVDIEMYADKGYKFDCTSLTDTSNTSSSYGIGLVTVGSKDQYSQGNSNLQAADFLQPDKYTLTCEDKFLSFHMPASSWTNATPEHGQFVKIMVQRIQTDLSWQPDEGVYGTATVRMTGQKDFNYRYFNPAPGSSARGGGHPLTGISQVTAPTLTSSTQCGVRSDVTLPTQDGVVYTKKVSADGNTVTVSATPAGGYYFEQGVTRSWTFTIPPAVPCDVDAEFNKSWDPLSQSWTITVTNPSKTLNTKPLSLADNVFLRDASGKVTDLKGERITNPSVGTVSNDTWEIPALSPGSKATATLIANADWLKYDNASLVNRLEKTGSACLVAGAPRGTCREVVSDTPVDPVWGKTYNPAGKYFELKVSNPTDKYTRPVTLADNLWLHGYFWSDIQDEVISIPSKGTVSESGNSWSVPVLAPGESATARVQVKDSWMAINGGTLVNRFGPSSDACLIASNPSGVCAEASAPIPALPTWSKSYDSKSHTFKLTVTNPSKSVESKPVNLQDNAWLSLNGKITDLSDESIDGGSDVWKVPALGPGQSVTATVKAPDSWFQSDGGTIINRLGPVGSSCLDAKNDEGSCASSTALVPVNPVLSKTYDAESKSYVVTVSNPSKVVESKPVTVTDYFTVIPEGSDSTHPELTFTKVEVGTSSGSSWQVPSLPANSSVKASVNVPDEVLDSGPGYMYNAVGFNDACSTSTKTTKDCAVTDKVSLDSTPTFTKSWDADTMSWVIEVTNPSKEHEAKSITLADNIFIRNQDGSIKDLDDPLPTWETPRLAPGESVVKTIKSDPKWLVGTGSLVNRLGVDGSTCLQADQNKGTCVEVSVGQIPEPKATEVTPVEDEMAKTGFNMLAVLLPLSLVLFLGGLLKAASTRK